HPQHLRHRSHRGAERAHPSSRDPRSEPRGRKAQPGAGPGARRSRRRIRRLDRRDASASGKGGERWGTIARSQTVRQDDGRSETLHRAVEAGSHGGDGRGRLMKKGAAIAAVLGIILGAWGYWFYSRSYDAARLLQCLPSDRSLHVYMNVGLLRSAGILELLAGSQGAEEPDYKKFIEQTGFDYRTDLDAVAAGFRDGDEYFAAQGRFNWNKLADYSRSHQGSCQDRQCSMPANQPGKTISFTLLRNDVLALAVAKDAQAVRVIFPGFWKEPPKIPAAAVWVSAPPYIFSDAKNLPAGMGPFRSQLEK